jgi:hypothetical protein
LAILLVVVLVLLLLGISGGFEEDDEQENEDEQRVSRREEAPSEVPAEKLEPPYVGCYGSGVQSAKLRSANSLPGGEGRGEGGR